MVNSSSSECCTWVLESFNIMSFTVILQYKYINDLYSRTDYLGESHLDSRYKTHTEYCNEVKGGKVRTNHDDLLAVPPNPYFLSYLHLPPF